VIDINEIKQVKKHDSRYFNVVMKNGRIYELYSAEGLSQKWVDKLTEELNKIGKMKKSSSRNSLRNSFFGT